MNFSRRRVIPITLAIALIAALAIGVSQSSASKVLRATRLIQSQKSTCDDSDNGNGRVGNVQFLYNAQKNKLDMVVNVTGGLPSTTYTFYVLDASTCDLIVGPIGSGRTKSNGKGRFKLHASVPGYSQFVLDAWDGSNDNDSRPADFS
jgi:hypothetical protein